MENYKFFSGWQILIWQKGGHMFLSMRILNKIGRFNFGEWAKNHQICQMKPKPLQIISYTIATLVNAYPKSNSSN